MSLSRCIGLLALIIALYILWQIQQLLLLAFTAIVLVTALNQLVKQFQQWKLRRSLAVWLSVAALIIILSIFFLLIVPPFVQQFGRLIELLPSSITEIEEILERLTEFLPQQPWLDFTEIDNLFQQIQPWIERFVDQSLNIFLTSINTILIAIALLDSPWKAGAVLILYLVIQQIESYWLTPTIMAK
jgi:predicted PurR-regulated permease PerM